MKRPRVTLDQWRALIALAEGGTYAAAAAALHRTPSAVHDAVRQIQEALDIEVVQVRGRQTRLSPAGQALLRRARLVVDEASRLEQDAVDLAQGWEPQLGLAVEMLFPPTWLLEVLARFAPESRSTRLELYESVLSATTDRLIHGDAQLAITPHVPAGFLGEPLGTVTFLAVAHPDHPLHQRPKLELADLRGERQLVVRDPGSRQVDAGWLGAERRWTVSDLRRSAEAVAAGLGFAWLPEPMIRDQLETGRLRQLPLAVGASRPIQLFLVYGDPDRMGPATRILARIIREVVAAH